MSASVSLARAQQAVDAAVRAAAETTAAVSVAVVDDGGHIVASARCDGATFVSHRLAASKAATAAGFGAPTRELGQALSGDPTVFGAMTAEPGITLLPGGLPLTEGGALVGGIGVAGGTNGEDVPIAERAVATYVASDAALAN